MENTTTLIRKLMKADDGSMYWIDGPTHQSIKSALVKVINIDQLDLDAFDSDYVRIFNIDSSNQKLLDEIRNAFDGVYKFKMTILDAETVTISYNI